MERGVIRNPDIAQILQDFSGLRFERGITPTDIDGFVEFEDDVYIIIETKYRDTRLSGGQRKALERLCDRIGDSRRCLLIVAKHEVQPCMKEFIKVAECEVTEYRSRGRWFNPVRTITVRQIIDKYRMRVRNEKAKALQGR
jgi:hypothetical protein